MIAASRCSARPCVEQATRWLIHPDGGRNPGGYVCQDCADKILSEYRDKLGESWSTVPILEAQP
jgi:hypothetical protein